MHMSPVYLSMCVACWAIGSDLLTCWCGTQKFFPNVYIAEQVDRLGVGDPYCKCVVLNRLQLCLSRREEQARLNRARSRTRMR